MICSTNRSISRGSGGLSVVVVIDRPRLLGADIVVELAKGRQHVFVLLARGDQLPHQSIAFADHLGELALQLLGLLDVCAHQNSPKWIAMAIAFSGDFARSFLSARARKVFTVGSVMSRSVAISVRVRPRESPRNTAT